MELIIHKNSSEWPEIWCRTCSIKVVVNEQRFSNSWNKYGTCIQPILIGFEVYGVKKIQSCLSLAESWTQTKKFRLGQDLIWLPTWNQNLMQTVSILPPKFLIHLMGSIKCEKYMANWKYHEHVKVFSLFGMPITACECIEIRHKRKEKPSWLLWETFFFN